MAPDQVSQIGARLASAGIGLLCLKTDLFSNGQATQDWFREGIAPADRLPKRASHVTIATNKKC